VRDIIRVKCPFLLDHINALLFSYQLGGVPETSLDDYFEPNGRRCAARIAGQEKEKCQIVRQYYPTISWVTSLSEKLASMS
jgi:hypothetical protein